MREQEQPRRAPARARRVLSRLALAALVLTAGLFAGFRFWLSRQPNETRLAIEAFTTLEFLSVLRDEVLARPIEDFGAYGRRLEPGRGHAPWVLRASLDGRPRMLLVAIAPERWIAWSTETASIRQIWRGGVDFSGPAFDARHGFEPMSRGLADWRAGAATGWRVEEADGAWAPAQIRWRGHGFEPGTRRLWLAYDVGDRAGRFRRVVERPERVGDAGSPGAVGFALERIFELGGAASDPSAGGLPALALVVAPSATSTETDGRLEPGGLLRLEPGRTRLVQTFATPGDPIVHATTAAASQTVFSAHDCETCHHARERVVGPAWQEIARREAGSQRDAAAALLADRIRGGSVGRWGDVAMPPHPELSREEATTLSLRILESIDDIEPSAAESSSADAAVATTYAYDVGPRPEALHPSLRAAAIAPSDFTPRVGGLAWLPDGRLAVATWDRDGSVFALRGWDGPREQVEVRRIAEGLHEPLGLVFARGALHVIHKQEITRLVDQDGDDRIDEYRTLSNDWTTTSNFHEFGFGLPAVGQWLHFGLSACVMKGGKSCPVQTRDRGRLMRASLATGEVETLATGFRTPNGIAATPDGAILVTDNQGDWLPASKLIRIEPGADYGWRPPGETPDPQRVTSPTLWLPHNEIANSPTQPLVLTRGPYAGQILFGDVYNGGLKRAVLEEVAGRWQGAAFHFSGGLQGPVNRLLELPSGGLVVGEIGSRGNWGELGKPWYGLELLRFEDEAAFEPRRVSVSPTGFEVELTRALAEHVLPAAARFRVEDWFYVPSPAYGGPKHDLRRLAVESVGISRDRRVLSLAVPGLAAGRVVYLRLDPSIRSERDEALWVDEAWYTIHALPTNDAKAAPVPLDPLTPEERAAGWELLFDGSSFSGWKNYGAPTDAIEGWRIVAGALEFTRDVSFAGLVWNHLNPFGRPVLDLMTKERFRDFELTLEWQVEPGGNSGIFYRVPDERERVGWARALEMQVLDDARHADGRKEKRRAGDLYDVVAGAQRVVKPAGEWNSVRIRVDGDRVEHWLNGTRIVDIEVGSAEWNEAVAASKHAGTADYGRAREGFILLQDHGDPVRYRNIKLRRLAGRPNGAGR